MRARSKALDASNLNLPSDRKVPNKGPGAFINRGRDMAVLRGNAACVTLAELVSSSSYLTAQLKKAS